MTDILGPMDAANSVTVRPADERTPTGSDTFFKNCSSSAAVDGTKIGAGWLNQVSVALRALARGNGLKLDGTTKVLAEDNTNDAILLQAAQHLIQRGLTNVGYDTGTANAASVTFSPAPAELVAGMRFWIKKYTSANTGAMTLNGVALNWADGSALVAGDWPASVFAEVIYNGATYGLLSVMGPSVFSRKSATIVPFTSSTTFTVPAGIYTIKRIQCWGAGGGGGGSFGAGGAGSGAGAGGYDEAVNVAVTPGSSITVAIGAGGTAGAGTPTNGGNGGTSTFGGLCTAAGGLGGWSGNSALQTSGSGAGGAGSVGSLPLTGQGGGLAFTVGIPCGGIGGAAPFGGAPPAINVGGNGSGGNFPGGGGNGGSAGGAGGVGANGFIIIEY
jgi:hypothetical protein